MASQTESAQKAQTFGNRLNGCRLRRGWTQTDLAENLGASLRSVQNWENGANIPSPKKLRTMAAILGVPLDFLLGEDKAAPTPKMSGGPYFGTSKEVPVISWASAGASNEYQDQGYDVEHIPTDCKDPNCYAVVVEGDSMLPRFEPGDIVIAMPNAEPRNGDLVVAKSQDGSAYFKLYHRKGHAGDIIQLTSYNDQRYPPLEFHRPDILFLHPVHSILRRARR